MKSYHTTMRVYQPKITLEPFKKRRSTAKIFMDKRVSIFKIYLK